MRIGTWAVIAIMVFAAVALAADIVPLPQGAQDPAAEVPVQAGPQPSQEVPEAQPPNGEASAPAAADIPAETAVPAPPEVPAPADAPAPPATAPPSPAPPEAPPAVPGPSVAPSPAMPSPPVAPPMPVPPAAAPTAPLTVPPMQPVPLEHPTIPKTAVPPIPPKVTTPAGVPFPAHPTPQQLPGGVPAPPGVPGAVPSPRFVPATGGGFLVKFNNADVYEVIHTLGRIAGINYLIDPRVRGVVNVHTQGTVKKEDALEILFSILRINGATAVLEGGVYHIVPMNEAKMEPLPVGGKEDLSSPNRPTMKAFPLQYIAAAEMAKVIKPFLSAGGDAVEVPRANILLVVDTAGNMEKHARLVELFDADAFKSAGVRLFPLKFLDPEEMAKSLDAVFGALDFGSKGGRPSGINFVPLARLNALLVVSASPKTLTDVERWIGELDREPSSTSRSVHLYRVRHGKVRDLAEILGKLYPSRAASLPSKTTEFKPAVAEPVKPFILSSPPPSSSPPSKSSSASAASAEKKEGEGYDIIPDEPTNSLIIRGSASEYAAILETLNAIDVYPRQVLLEVLIGEVQLDDTLRLGIDWTYIRQIGDVSHNVSMTTSNAGLTSGLKYLVDKTDRLSAAFRSLANDGKVSILSAPSVIAANGHKSKIQVADSIPISTANIVANSNPPVTTETVEYRDVGVILTFTPFINDKGIVTLEIEQEVSDVSTTQATSTANPSFFKRIIQTTLIATEDRSIVLGGLVKERKSLSREGVPFFYKIPLIGWIFGARSGALTRNELVIFITPRVIGDVEEGTRLSREFEDRVVELKTRMGEARGIKKAPVEPKDVK